MRLLAISMLLALIGCSRTIDDTFLTKTEKQANSFALSLKVGDCFRFERTIKAEFSFEKTFLYQDRIHVVMAIDPGKAMLIAQPDADCGEELESSKCEYWFRTHPHGNGFLIRGLEKKVTCPQELSLQKMRDRLENSNYKNRYKL